MYYINCIISFILQLFKVSNLLLFPASFLWDILRMRPGHTPIHLTKGTAFSYNDAAGEDTVKSAEIWVFIFILGLLGINWPILEIFHTQVAAYLFATWVLFIALIALAARKGKAENESHDKQ